MRKLIGLVLVCPLALAGCGDDDGGMRDAATDTLIVLPDGGTDTGGDTGGSDTGGGDTGGVCGDLGEACTPDRGCRRSAFCQAEITFDLAGTPPETIVGLPAGTDTTGLFFGGGYCTPDDFSGSSLNICDPADDADTTCGPCGSCVNLGQDTMCALSCTPTSTDNSDCRDDGYSCDLNLEVCFPGCNSDAECLIGRQESNGFPGIQTPADCEDNPADCGGSMTDADNLVYDTTSDATCNMTNFRCEFTGDPAASAGDTCAVDGDCESNGDCINFTNDDGSEAWPGGYCTKFRCDLDGRGCAAGGKCQERGLGIFLCVDGCTVGTGTGVDPGDDSTWRVAEGGCRDGYTCNWDGMGGAGVADNGGCVPGGFTDVTDPNTGDPCTTDDQCWSPFGRGFCITESDDGGGFVGGYCSVRDCGSPGLPTGICGPGATCIPGFDADDPTFALCLDECATPADCNDGYGCIDIDGSGALVCFASCAIDDECKATQRCNIPAGAMAGECVDR